MKRLFAVGFVLVFAATLGCTTTSPTARLLGAVGAGGAVGVTCGLLGGHAGLCAGLAAITAAGTWAAIEVTEPHGKMHRAAGDESQPSDYQPVDGIVIQIRQWNVEPQVVRAGESLSVTTQYSVLAPIGVEEVEVTESWELWHGDERIAELSETEVKRKPAGWEVDFEMTVPPDAEPGTYTIRHQIEAGDDSVVKHSSFDIV